MTKINDDGTYWGRYARSYDRDTDYVVGRSLRRALYRLLAAEGDPGHVLECGCGAGYYTRALVDRAISIVATDISGEMLAAAEERLKGMPHVSFRQVDCMRRTFPSTSFDTVLMANILNTLSRPLPALREAHRVLKYGGVLICIAYTDHDVEALEKIAIRKRYLEKFGLPPPGGLTNYSAPQLGALVTKAGFKIGKLDVLGDRANAIYVRAIKAVMICDGDAPAKSAA